MKRAEEIAHGPDGQGQQNDENMVHSAEVLSPFKIAYPI